MSREYESVKNLECIIAKYNWQENIRGLGDDFYLPKENNQKITINEAFDWVIDRLKKLEKMSSLTTIFEKDKKYMESSKKEFEEIKQEEKCT